MRLERFPMTSHRSRLVTLPKAPVRGRCLPLALAFALALAGVTTFAAAADPAHSSGSDKPGSDKKVYTNADLKKYATEADEGSAVTNRQLKAPLPSQPAPIVDSSGDWSFVLAMLDREREEAARSRDAAYAAAAAAAEADQPEPEPMYSAPYPLFYNYGASPFPRRPHHHPRVPTNTYRPLDERGVRTAQDLWNEAQRNAQIQQSQVFPRNFPYAVVHPH